MGYPVQTLKSFQKIVATAGTELPLTATSILVSKCRIRALDGNTGLVYVGDSTVSSTNGYPLTKGDELVLEALLDNQDKNQLDLSAIYVDAASNADGVAVIYCD